MVSPAEIKIMAAPMNGDAEMREIPSERSLKMAYKKPKMVAKSSAKKSYVAGCPERTQMIDYCHNQNKSCQVGPLQ